MYQQLCGAVCSLFSLPSLFFAFWNLPTLSVSIVKQFIPHSNKTASNKISWKLKTSLAYLKAQISNSFVEKRIKHKVKNKNLKSTEIAGLLAASFGITLLLSLLKQGTLTCGENTSKAK